MITDKIVLHRRLYEESGLEVPPFRLTYNEHKQLVKEIAELFKIKNHDHDYDFIGYYYNVSIEVVTLIK